MALVVSGTLGKSYGASTVIPVPVHLSVSLTSSCWASLTSPNSGGHSALCAFKGYHLRCSQYLLRSTQLSTVSMVGTNHPKSPSRDTSVIELGRLELLCFSFAQAAGLSPHSLPGFQASAHSRACPGVLLASGPLPLVRPVFWCSPDLPQPLGSQEGVAKPEVWLQLLRPR